MWRFLASVYLNRIRTSKKASSPPQGNHVRPSGANATATPGAGAWYMVYGLQFPVYGLWFEVHGLWVMGYGLWFMVYGLWFRVCIWFRIVYGWVCIWLGSCMVLCFRVVYGSGFASAGSSPSSGSFTSASASGILPSSYGGTYRGTSLIRNTQPPRITTGP